MSVADRLAPFGTSIFTDMTRLAIEHDAINLGQGFPDWDGPGFVKLAAARSLEGGHDQYPPSHGVPELREAIAARYGPLFGRDLDVSTEITVTAGCTEALAASFLGLIDPGDEVVVIEPFYDSYPVNLALAGAVPRYVTLRPPLFEIDEAEMRAAFNDRTRAVVVNTPHNPTGRLFSAEEVALIAELCRRYDAIAITDEVYEEIIFDGEHRRLAATEGMWDRTVTLSSLGKTFSLTGWKVGWAIAPPHLTAGIRAAHQFLTFTTPTPVQFGTAEALRAPDTFYSELRSSYRSKRELLMAGLEEVGFEVYPPQGTYFMMAGHAAFGQPDDRAFCRYLVETVGVVAIPPSVFYHRPEDGASLVRFAFCKDEATLTDAVQRMQKLAKG